MAKNPPSSPELQTSSPPDAAGLELLRSAIHADPAEMRSLLDAGAPLEAILPADDALRDELPHHLRHRVVGAPITALGLSCLMAANHYAILDQSNDAARCATMLIERGAHPDGAGMFTWTPMLCIAMQTVVEASPGRSWLSERRLNLLQALARAGAKFDVEGPAFDTPLGACLDHENLAMALAAKALGADIERRDFLGRTELWRRASKGLTESLRTALSLGCDPDSRCLKGQSALSATLGSHTHRGFACASMLIQAGCSVGADETKLVADSPFRDKLLLEIAAAEQRALSAAAPEPAPPGRRTARPPL